jgi:hypothetical protein
MFHQKRKWISLGRSAELLECHVTTLRYHLDKPGGCGFSVYEETSENGKRLRYLALDEIRRAMAAGEGSIS